MSTENISTKNIRRENMIPENITPANTVPRGHKIVILKARTTLQKDGKMVRAVVMDFPQNKLEDVQLAKVFHEVVQVAFDQLHAVNDPSVQLDPNDI
uniref:Uncharacterized protein n=1 Tax=Panagrolaimus superbus TaxID=310955 RepID=A0A914YFP0_9BILA